MVPFLADRKDDRPTLRAALELVALVRLADDAGVDGEARRVGGAVDDGEPLILNLGPGREQEAQRVREGEHPLADRLCR